MSSINVENAPRTLEGMIKLTKSDKYRLALLLSMFGGDENAEQAFHILSPDGQAQALFNLLVHNIGNGSAAGSNGQTQMPILHTAPQAPPPQQMQMVPTAPMQMVPVPMMQAPSSPAQMPVTRTPVTVSDPGNSGSKSMAAPTPVQHPPPNPPMQIQPPQSGATSVAALQAINGQLRSLMEKVGGLEETINDIDGKVESIEETMAGHARLLQLSAMLGVTLTEASMPKVTRQEILKMIKMYLDEGELKACLQQMEEEEEAGKE